MDGRTSVERVRVKVSAASARQRFHGCEPGYIATVCRAACCRSSTSESGINVAIGAREQLVIEALGGTVTDGMLGAVNRRCPFEGPTHLCELHERGLKPFGCQASPFTLNPNGTLIIRNRYRLLKCYNDDRDGPPPPAYKAFAQSLVALFGSGEAARLTAWLDDGRNGDTPGWMLRSAHESLTANTAARKASA